MTNEHHQTWDEEKIARLNLVLEGYKVLAGLSDPDPIKILKIIESKLQAGRDLAKALKKAIGDIESEYCSHRNPHGATNWECYGQEYYVALQSAREKGLV